MKIKNHYLWKNWKMSIEQNYERIIKKNRKDWKGLGFCLDCMYYGNCLYRTYEQIQKGANTNRGNCPYWKEYQEILERKNERKIRKKII